MFPGLYDDFDKARNLLVELEIVAVDEQQLRSARVEGAQLLIG